MSDKNTIRTFDGLRRFALLGFLMSLGYLFLEPYIPGLEQAIKEIEAEINEEFNFEQEKEILEERNYEEEYSESIDYENSVISLELLKSKFFVYKGVINPITITVEGYNSDQLSSKLSTDCGTLKHAGGNNYHLIPNRGSGVCYIDVALGGNNSESIEMQLSEVPQPVARFAALSSGTVEANTFKNQRGLFTDIPDFDLDVHCRITSFGITYKPANSSQVISLPNQSPLLEAPTAALVKLAKSGDQYLFDDIKCKCPGERQERKLDNLEFVIK